MKRTNISQMFLALLLFGMFVLCSFYVILLGANSYSEVVNNNQIENKFRLTFDYLRVKFEEVGINSRVSIKDNLIILDYDNYDVVIYEDEGLNELITKEYYDGIKLDGESIIDIDGFDINENDGIYEFIVNINQEERKMEVSLR